jgi:hypothetical protein
MMFLTIHYTKVNTIKLRLKRAFPGDVMSGDMEEMNVRRLIAHLHSIFSEVKMGLIDNIAR